MITMGSVQMLGLFVFDARTIMEVNDEKKSKRPSLMTPEQVLQRMDEYVDVLNEYPDSCSIYEEVVHVIEGFMALYQAEAVARLGAVDTKHRTAINDSHGHHDPTCPLAGPNDFPASP